LLKNEIFSFLRIERLRASVGEEVKFVNVMWFDAPESVKAFASVDYAAAAVPQRRAHCSNASLRTARAP